MNKNKSDILTFVALFILIVIVGGISFAFFNYTRTGNANIVKTGNISFNAVQGNSFNLTNLFPITANATNLSDNTKVGILTIHVTGSTDYKDGVEYLISTTDVVNSVGRRNIPVSIDVSYSANGEGKEIGTLDYDYFENHGGDESIYRPLAGNVLKNNERLLVGYIAPGEDEIDGNITIKAYLDEDIVVISDTYQENLHSYVFNKNMTDTEYNNCVNYFIDEMDYIESEAKSLCKGERENVFSNTMQEYVDSYVSTINSPKPSNMTEEEYNFWREWCSNVLDDLVNMNVIQEVDYQNGTTEEWANGRTVLTTTEWNSLADDGISFKVKVEANEGIWVESEVPTMSEMCPNCVFGYSTESIYTTWNTDDETPTVVTSGFTSDYRGLVASSGKSIFTGIIRNDDNQVTRAFVCGMIHNDPICIETMTDATLNDTSIQTVNAFFDSNQCGILDSSWGNYYMCESDSVYYSIYDYGYIETWQHSNYCYVDEPGEILCYYD